MAGSCLAQSWPPASKCARSRAADSEEPEAVVFDLESPFGAGRHDAAHGRQAGLDEARRMQRHCTQTIAGLLLVTKRRGIPGRPGSLSWRTPRWRPCGNCCRRSRSWPATWRRSPTSRSVSSAARGRLLDLCSAYPWDDRSKVGNRREGDPASNPRRRPRHGQNRDHVMLVSTRRHPRAA